MTPVRLRQAWADLMASFWLRPSAMTLVAILLAAGLVGAEGMVDLPDGLADLVYAGGTAGARDVLGTVASATIGVAGTTFSITVAALTLASNQMGPRLLRNFTRDAGNQYALGAFLATFAYSLVALRSVHEAEEGAFVPQLAVSVGLLMAFGCVGVLIWFLHHVATSISVDRVVALVHRDLSTALEKVDGDAAALPPAPRPDQPTATLTAPASGYLRVLDEDTLADWAAGQDAVLWLRVRPGDFVFIGTEVAEVVPARLRAEAQDLLDRAISLGDARSIEQDLEFAVRQLVEIALRALSPGINDPFTAITVLDRLGAALCLIAGRSLPSAQVRRDGRTRLVRPVTDYPGLVDAMFHMLRQAAATQPAVIIRLMEVLTSVSTLERDAERRAVLRGHLDLARDAGFAGTEDAAAREALVARHGAALALLRG
ncbi:DUF2254 domain-containing protein [Falsiroseomonas sp. HC035]|uniref:DUF2254 domain-containing protein n=1 Tax=Falsiroseomonas sp. HC035 TaxID=3390999 RepID=UPI003D31E057